MVIIIVDLGGGVFSGEFECVCVRLWMDGWLNVGSYGLSLEYRVDNDDWIDGTNKR